MNRKICISFLIAASVTAYAGAYAQTQAPVVIEPIEPIDSAQVQSAQPAAMPSMPLSVGGQPQDAAAKAAQDAAVAKAAAEAEAQRKAGNIKKFSHLLPEIEGATDKIGMTFWESYWGHMLVGSIIAIVVLAIVFRKKKKYEPTPFEVAKNRLELSDTIYMELGAKAYAQEVSQAIRDYIEAVHNLPAPERTTEEFLTIASTAPQLDVKEHEILAKILKLADMAKFAQHSFKEEEKKQLLHDAQDFIFYDHDKIEAAQKAANNTESPKEDFNKDQKNTDSTNAESK